MPILNYTTKIPANRTIQEIQTKLAKAGAKGVLCEYDDNGEPERITFNIDTPHGLMYFKLPANIAGVSKALSDDNCYRDEGHARRVAWRILKDWIEAQLAIIEANMAELSQVFLPYAQTGTGETLYERVASDGLKLLEQK
jgi:hypothetical protein